MRSNNFPEHQNQNQKQTGQSRSDLPASINRDQSAVEFVPSPDEVARKAYFCYVNEGSPQGRDVQHWLKAEAELIKERDRTRTHGFHN